MNPTNHWKLGAFVIGALVLGFATLVWLGAADWNRRSRTVVTYFDESVQGLEVGAPLKFRGVAVGTVTEISIAPDLRHVKVTGEVYEDVLERLGLAGQRPVLQQMEESGVALRVQVASAGITGVKFLLVDFFDAKRFPVEELPFDPGPDYFPAAASTLKSIEEAVVEVGMQLPMLTMQASHTLVKLTDAVENFERTIRPLVAEGGGIDRLLAQYERTGAQFERAAAAIETEVRAAELARTTATVRDAAGSISGLSADLAVTAEDARGSLSALRETLDSVRTLSDYLERDPAALVRGRAEPAADGGPRR